ncbi:MAG TPA: Hpt domain-containing protein, partial [Stellaceae bacterium]|nr:Hpt domain-containing protein [Stellaceae bacterium]
DDRVTSIAAHPRYAPETATPVDARVMAGLRALSGGGEFLGEVIDSFRADSRQIMERIGAAAGAGDTTAFVRGIHALRRCAATLGGASLCELALSLRDVSAAELRQQNGAIVQRLSAELARLDAALVEYLPRAG